MKRSPTPSIILAAILFLCPLSLCSAEDLTDSASDQYRVAGGDTLDITVYQEDDLSGTFEVNEDGTISYPLLGPVQVEGLTKLDIETSLTALLRKDYLVTPHVRVSIGSYYERQVLLLGHVQHPGTYVFPEGKDFSLLEVLTMAGGFTGYAAVNGTKIVRTMENGEKTVIDPRMNDIINGRRDDEILLPGDLIIVPERLF